jgi:hypothetical protein
MHGINIYIHERIYNAISLVNPLLLPPLICFIPLYTSQPTLFYLLGDPTFGDRSANVRTLSSLASNQLLTPCCLTLPEDAHGSCYMFT